MTAFLRCPSTQTCFFFFLIAFYIICVNLKVYFPTHVGLGPGDGCGFQVVFDNRSDVEVRQMDVTCGKQTVSAQQDKEHPLHVLDGGSKLQDYGAFLCHQVHFNHMCPPLHAAHVGAGGTQTRSICGTNL